MVLLVDTLWQSWAESEQKKIHPALRSPSHPAFVNRHAAAPRAVRRKTESLLHASYPLPDVPIGHCGYRSAPDPLQRETGLDNPSVLSVPVASCSHTASAVVFLRLAPLRRTACSSTFCYRVFVPAQQLHSLRLKLIPHDSLTTVLCHDPQPTYIATLALGLSPVRVS